MRLHLRTVPESEALQTFPQRVLSHAPLKHNATALIITGVFGERYGYYVTSCASRASGGKEGVLYIDDPEVEHAFEGCDRRHFLEAPCSYFEMAAAAKKLLGQ